MGATRSRLVRAGASPQQGLFNKIELFPSSMPPPCPGPGSAWAQRCRPRPQQGQEPQQSGLRGFHRVQQFRRGTRTVGCQGKTPMCKGGKPHPRGCGWEHPTRGSCPGDEPVPILQRGPCPAHHLCSTVIPKSELRPAGFCPISPFLAVQVVLEPLHPLPEVLHSSVRNKGEKDFWEPSSALVPFQTAKDSIPRFVGDSSSWPRHVGFCLLPAFGNDTLTWEIGIRDPTPSSSPLAG